MYLFNPEADAYLDKMLANKTVIAFSDIYKHCSKELAIHYFAKIVCNLDAGRHGYVSIKIAARFFREYSKTREQSHSQFADLIEEEFKLFQSLIDELGKFLKLAIEKCGEKVRELEAANKKVDYSKMSDETYFDLFSHSNQLTERLNFIKDFASYGSFMMKKEQLTLLWDALTTNNPLVKDHEAFYVWLRKVSEDVLKDGKTICDQSELIAFFREKIGSELTDFTNLSLEGYYCI